MCHVTYISMCHVFCVMFYVFEYCVPFLLFMRLNKYFEKELGFIKDNATDSVGLIEPLFCEDYFFINSKDSPVIHNIFIIVLIYI